MMVYSSLSWLLISVSGAGKIFFSSITVLYQFILNVLNAWYLYRSSLKVYLCRWKLCIGFKSLKKIIKYLGYTSNYCFYKVSSLCSTHSTSKNKVMHTQRYNHILIQEHNIQCLIYQYVYDICKTLHILFNEYLKHFYNWKALFCDINYCEHCWKMFLINLHKTSLLINYT